MPPDPPHNIAPAIPSESEWHARLLAHNWSYHYTSDGSAFSAAKADDCALRTEAERLGGWHLRHYNLFIIWAYSGPQYNLPQQPKPTL